MGLNMGGGRHEMKNKSSKDKYSEHFDKEFRQLAANINTTIYINLASKSSMRALRGESNQNASRFEKNQEALSGGDRIHATCCNTCISSAERMKSI